MGPFLPLKAKKKRQGVLGPFLPFKQKNTREFWDPSFLLNKKCQGVLGSFLPFQAKNAREFWKISPFNQKIQLLVFYPVYKREENQGVSRWLPAYFSPGELAGERERGRGGEKRYQIPDTTARSRWDNFSGSNFSFKNSQRSHRDYFSGSPCRL